MKCYSKFLSTILVFLFYGQSLLSADPNDFVLVIDPGHGGNDPGAIGSKSKEKNINLEVALLFGELVTSKHPDVKVIFTRKTDKFLDLKARSDLANKENADLFISIHTNASVNHTPSGTETFTLGLARTADNMEVAKRENSVILLEDNYQRKYEGFDPKSSESYIIFEFLQNKFMEQSVDFASTIQKELKNSSKRADRGVKQAGFLVLRETSMPSALVELGFISNLTEEEYMTSNAGKKSLANSLLNAFTQYKSDHDRKSGHPKTTPDSPTVSHKKNDSTKTNTKSETIIYKIQILVSETELAANSPRLKGYKPEYYIDTDGLYKYTFGDTADPVEANKMNAKAKKDFPDAFLIKFTNGIRVK